MVVQLEVDAKQFEELMNSSIKELPKEKIHEIITEGIRNYLADPSVIDKLFVERNEWGSVRYPTSFLRELISKAVAEEDGFADIREEALQQIKTNLREILQDAMIGLLSNSLFNTDQFSQSVREVLMSHKSCY